MKAACVLAALSLAACSGGERRGEEGVSVVEGGVVPVRPAAARSRPAVAATPVATASSPPSLDAPMTVHGDVTEQPLPAELAHLNGLGATSSRAEESTP